MPVAPRTWAIKLIADITKYPTYQLTDDRVLRESLVAMATLAAEEDFGVRLQPPFWPTIGEFVNCLERSLAS